LLRLDAEAIRDALLSISEQLDRRQGGPSVPTQRTDGGEVIPEDPSHAGFRRSVYLQQRRTQVPSLLEVFDAPSIVTTCTRRLPSTVPLQSLAMMNSEFVVGCAEKLVIRLEREIPGDDDPVRRIDHTFVLAVGRPADDRERTAALRFVQTQPVRYPGLSQVEARR
jgi:hypothetical protein